MRILDAGDLGLAVGAGGQFVIEELPPIGQHRRHSGISGRIFRVGGSVDHVVAEGIEFVDRGR